MIKNLIFLGAPGVGKGTLAKKVAQKQNMVHISTGVIFRKEINSGSQLGEKIKNIVANGKYISDDITNSIVKKTLEQKEVKEKGFILDGYPRTINQAKFLKGIDVNITKAILLAAKDETINKRLINRAIKENREDDTPEVIANRIRVYKEKTAPLIDWYQKESLLKEIDCEGDIDQNYDNLMEVVFNDYN